MGADHWGMTPCGGRVSIRWGALDPSLNAQSSWVNPVDDFAQPSRNTDCQMTLSTGDDVGLAEALHGRDPRDRPPHGHDHVDDPTDIMYFAYVQPAPECAAMAEPVETGVPAAAPRAVATPPKKPARVAKAKVVKKRTKAKRRR